MGWNLSFATIKDCSLEDLAAHGFTARGSVTPEAAPDHLVAVPLGADVVLAGPYEPVEDAFERLGKAGLGCCTVALSSVADTYHFAVYDGGRLVRELSKVEGQVTGEVGDRLPREELADGEEFDEDRFLALWEIAGGQGLGEWFFAENGGVEVVSGSVSADPASPPSTRRWFRRSR